MRKPITIGQSHNLVSVLANNVDWNELDSNVVQQIIENPKEAGARFTALLKGWNKVVTSPPGILKIDRTTPFNPKKFIGEIWEIEEEDRRSLALTEVDLTKVCLESYLGHLGGPITGEENLVRAKEMKDIRLDAKIFQSLWENSQLIPESWRKKYLIFFDGTVLRSLGGSCCVLCLRWSGGQWHRGTAARLAALGTP